MYPQDDKLSEKACLWILAIDGSRGQEEGQALFRQDKKIMKKYF